MPCSSTYVCNLFLPKVHLFAREDSPFFYFFLSSFSFLLLLLLLLLFSCSFANQMCTHCRCCCCSTHHPRFVRFFRICLVNNCFLFFSKDNDNVVFGEFKQLLEGRTDEWTSSIRSWSISKRGSKWRQASQQAYEMRACQPDHAISLPLHKHICSRQ